MSNRALTWAEAQVTGSVGRKAVLMVLADKADEENSCFPSQELLARITEQGVSTVRRHLKWLEAKGGFISRTRRNNPDGTRSSDRYVLNVSVAVGMAAPDAYRPDRAVGPALESSGRNLPAAASGSRPIKSRSARVSPPPAVSGRDEGLPLDLSAPTARSEQVTQREPKERKTKTPAAASGERPPTSTADPRFVEFWDACPRKIGKAEAFRKYAIAVKGGGASDRLLAGMRRYASAVRGKDPQFIAHPATWLHQGRWEDEHLPAVEQAGTRDFVAEREQQRAIDNGWMSTPPAGPGEIEKLRARRAELLAQQRGTA